MPDTNFNPAQEALDPVSTDVKQGPRIWASLAELDAVGAAAFHLKEAKCM
ncbi:hypothetical protein GQF56_21710 [Rhodobacter sphaeroides]|jgi:hypothetical protein|nr:hypothetical protein [Cereibacter sphaeroides]MVX50440.1 hypothetical protein [Cereibacter sphaeroides]